MAFKGKFSVTTKLFSKTRWSYPCSYLRTTPRRRFGGVKI